MITERLLEKVPIGEENEHSYLTELIVEYNEVDHDSRYPVPGEMKASQALQAATKNSIRIRELVDVMTALLNLDELAGVKASRGPADCND